MSLKLFFVILGATPPGRHTEQHDVFFGIGESLSDLLPDMNAFWPGAKLHIDSWRTVTEVNGYKVSIRESGTDAANDSNKLFFLNLGGYKPEDMEEYHYKLVCMAANNGDAIKQAKQTAFYKHTGFKGATSHIDDKYGIDVDDVHEIKDILPSSLKSKYDIILEEPTGEIAQDELHIGYVKFSSLMKNS